MAVTPKHENPQYRPDLESKPSSELRRTFARSSSAHEKQQISFELSHRLLAGKIDRQRPAPGPPTIRLVGNDA
jgi:hypothetical protein